MSDAECRERLARLEVNQKNFQNEYKQRTERQEKFHKESIDAQKILLDAVQKLQAEQLGDDGFWRGVRYLSSAIVSVISVGLMVAASRFFNGS